LAIFSSNCTALGSEAAGSRTCAGSRHISQLQSLVKGREMKPIAASSGAGEPAAITVSAGQLATVLRLADNPETLVTLKLVWDEWTSFAS
jgi:hypothetical protein